MSTEKPWMQRQPLANLTRGLGQRLTEGLQAVERSYQATIGGVRPGIQALRRMSGLPPLSQKEVMARWLTAMAEKPDTFSMLGDRVRSSRLTQSRRLGGRKRLFPTRAHGRKRRSQRHKALSEARLPRAQRTGSPLPAVDRRLERRSARSAGRHSVGRRHSMGRGKLAH